MASGNSPEYDEGAMVRETMERKEEKKEKKGKKSEEGKGE